MDAQRRAPTFQQLDPEDYGSALYSTSATKIDLLAVDMDMIEDNLAIMESMGVEAPEKLVDVDFFNRTSFPGRSQGLLITHTRNPPPNTRARVIRAFPCLSRLEYPLCFASRCCPPRSMFTPALGFDDDFDDDDLN